jgi:hypothetical protein
MKEEDQNAKVVQIELLKVAEAGESVYMVGDTYTYTIFILIRVYVHTYVRPYMYVYIDIYM